MALERYCRANNMESIWTPILLPLQPNRRMPSPPSPTRGSKGKKRSSSRHRPAITLNEDGTTQVLAALEDESDLEAQDSSSSDDGEERKDQLTASESRERRAARLKPRASQSMNDVIPLPSFEFHLYTIGLINALLNSFPL